MGDQRTFASVAWTTKKKVTRRERFLAEMDAVIPWAELVARIAPHYPKRRRGHSGRPPIPIETMLRIYFLHLLEQHRRASERARASGFRE